MKLKKAALIEALVRMSVAYAEQNDESCSEKFEETLARLKPWLDLDTTEKYSTLLLKRDMRAGRFGTSLKLIKKLLSKEIKEDAYRPMKREELHKLKLLCLEELGYGPLLEVARTVQVVETPSSYVPF